VKKEKRTPKQVRDVGTTGNSIDAELAKGGGGGEKSPGERWSCNHLVSAALTWYPGDREKKPG